MTVPSESSSTTYTGNGATTHFSTVWRARSADEVKVSLTYLGTTTVLSEGVHYTIPDEPADGSSAVMTVTWVTGAPVTGAIITIERDVVFTQGTALRTQGTYSPKVLEDALDESVFRDQELARRLSALESAGAPGSVVAGDGLAFSGTTLNVVAEPGLEASFMSLAPDWSTLAGSAVSAGAAVAGSRETISYSDHTHTVLTDAPVGIVAGATASNGASNYLARADHVHEVQVGTPVNVTKAAAANGTSATLARSDHKHDVSTAAAIDITDATNGEGASTSLARADHQHSHGNRGGGALHAAVTTSTNGFMSSADKVKLDGLVNESMSNTLFDTADATPAVAVTISPDNSSVTFIDATVVAKCLTGGDASKAAGYRLMATVRRFDNTLFLVGAVTVVASHETDAGLDATISVATPSARIVVTGLAATNFKWDITVRTYGG